MCDTVDLMCAYTIYILTICGLFNEMSEVLVSIIEFCSSKSIILFSCLDFFSFTSPFIHLISQSRKRWWCERARARTHTHSQDKYCGQYSVGGKIIKLFVCSAMLLLYLTSFELFVRYINKFKWNRYAFISFQMILVFCIQRCAFWIKKNTYTKIYLLIESKFEFCALRMRTITSNCFGVFACCDVAGLAKKSTFLFTI